MGLLTFLKLIQKREILMVNKYKLMDLNDSIDGKIDLFICSASFESRCLSISRSIELSKIRKAVIFYMKDSIKYINENKETLQNHFKDNAICVELKHADPLYTADRMRKALFDISKDCPVSSIVLDITTFTHESLLIILRIIPMVFPLATIKYAYTNAREYDSKNKKNDKWLSKGIGDIRSVLGFPGEILPARKTHLIVVVGYEFERAVSIINALEPSVLALAFGHSDNATTEKDKDANEHYLHLVEQMASSYQNVIRFEVKCDDPFETRRIIEKHISKYSDMNTVIIPLNNKISTLGVAFAALENPSIQLSYAPALVYNYSNYSTAGDSCYIISSDMV